MSRTTDRERKAPEEPGDADSPLRRWSRRKAQARGQPAPEEPVLPAAPPGPVPELTDADMPPIESLDRDSDYSVFFSPRVSEELRQRALRKLFHSGLFDERCPLDSEYYDCHGYEPLGAVITHEMRDEMEREAAKLKERAREALFAGDPGRDPARLAAGAESAAARDAPVAGLPGGPRPAARPRKARMAGRRKMAKARPGRHPRRRGA